MDLVFNEQNFRKICNINKVNCIASVVTEEGKKYLEAIKVDGSRVALTDPQLPEKYPNQPINEIKKRLGYEFSSNFTTMFGCYAINIYNFKRFEYRPSTKKEVELYVEFKDGSAQKVLQTRESSVKSFEPMTDRMAKTIYLLQKEKAEALGL